MILVTLRLCYFYQSNPQKRTLSIDSLLDKITADFLVTYFQTLRKILFAQWTTGLARHVIHLVFPFECHQIAERSCSFQRSSPDLPLGTDDNFMWYISFVANNSEGPFGPRYFEVVANLFFQHSPAEAAWKWTSITAAYLQDNTEHQMEGHRGNGHRDSRTQPVATFFILNSLAHTSKSFREYSNISPSTVIQRWTFASSWTRFTCRRTITGQSNISLFSLRILNKF